MNYISIHFSSRLMCPLLAFFCTTVALEPNRSTAAEPYFQETPQQREQRMAWWREARFGMFIHWGPVSLTGKELSWSRQGPRPYDHQALQEIPYQEYDRLYKKFNPTQFNAEQWVSVAEAAGMKYMVFTAKHHDGFSNYHTKLSDYNIADTPFKRDIVKELADACHTKGMRFGVYYSPRDWYHPDYLVGDNGKYNEFYHGQIRELLANYGQVDILWFDHASKALKFWKPAELLSMARQLQPGIIINNRCVAMAISEDPPGPNPFPEDFDTPEQHVGAFQNDRPWESCITLVGGQWSYKPDGEMFTLEKCIEILVQCVSGDGNLLLNIGPMPTGEIEPRQVERLKEIGAWLVMNGESIYGTRGGPFKPGPWGGSTYKDRTVYVHILKRPDGILHLPTISRKIVSHSILNGGQAKLAQQDHGIDIAIETSSFRPLDTIVKLELDGPAADIEPVNVPE